MHIIHLAIRLRAGYHRQQDHQQHDQYRADDEHGPATLVFVRQHADDRFDHQPGNRLHHEDQTDDERRIAPLFRYGRQERRKRRVTLSHKKCERIIFLIIIQV